MGSRRFSIPVRADLELQIDSAGGLGRTSRATGAHARHAQHCHGSHNRIGNPDDVHPTDKLDVGVRLARAARVLTYGENIEYSGPVFRQATLESGSIRAWFDHARGLSAKGGALTGFEVAGRDGKYVPATATIDGTTILVKSPDVPAPVYVRYGWANSPQCNVFNGEVLPASPFTSEQ